MALFNFLKNTAGNRPKAEAMVCGEKVCGKKSWTWEQTHARVLGLAAWLRGGGVRKGSRVAILSSNCHLFFESYFAAAALGVILVPLNTRLHPEEWSRILKHCGAKLLLTHKPLPKSVRSFLPASLKVVSLGSLDLDAGNSPMLRLPKVRPDDPAQIYYTSGTTGPPKGVVLTHTNVMSHAEATVKELGISEKDSWLHAAPMFHLADAWAVFAVTLAGGRHVFLKDFLPAKALALLSEETTITNLVPTMLNLLVHHPSSRKRRYPRLRLLMSGGAPIAPQLVKRVTETFKTKYVQTYGLTETSPYLTFSLLKPHLEKLSAKARFGYMASTGKPARGVEVKVVDEKKQRVKNDGKSVGEIICRGARVTPGYYKNPKATREAFRKGWFLTGDLATVDSEGYLRIVDRKKDVVLTGGETVYCVGVESILAAHPSVFEAAVFGVPDDAWGEAVTAAVVLRSGKKVSAGQLKKYCRRHMAAFETPKQFFFLKELPKTGSGKVLKKELRGTFGS